MRLFFDEILKEKFFRQLLLEEMGNNVKFINANMKGFVSFMTLISSIDSTGTDTKKFFIPFTENMFKEIEKKPDHFHKSFKSIKDDQQR